MTEAVRNWLRGNPSLVVAVTILLFWLSSLWWLASWTSRVEARISVIEQWVVQANPKIDKLDVLELRAEKLSVLMMKIGDKIDRINELIWQHMGEDKGRHDRSMEMPTGEDRGGTGKKGGQ